MKRSNTLQLKTYLKHYKRFSEDFEMPWTLEMEHKIIELYPNEIAIENYMMTKLLNHLDDKDRIYRVKRECKLRHELL